VRHLSLPVWRPHAPLIKGALKALGRRVLGEAADHAADGIVDSSANFLGPVVNAGIAQIGERWGVLFAAEQDDE